MIIKYTWYIINQVKLKLPTGAFPSIIHNISYTINYIYINVDYLFAHPAIIFIIYLYW